MRRTLALAALALSSLFAAVLVALLRPAVRPESRPGIRPEPPPAQGVRAGGLRMTTQLDRRYLPESGGAEAYLQIDLVADADPSARRRVPVNAVLILDRSGSMIGAKLDRARDAARALVQALGDCDRLAIVEFGSDTSVLVRSTEVTGAARVRALQAIEALRAFGGTNMSAAFDAAAPELASGHSAGRIDKVFLASDGQANEGISDHAGLLRLAQRDFAGATVSTFGMGEDYDEDLMTAFASQSGGRARYIVAPEVLPGAVREELSRAAAAVARNVRLRIDGASGASIERVLGYEVDGSWARLPDFAAGEERRVLVKLRVPPGRGISSLAQVELRLDDVASGVGAAAVSSVQAAYTADPALLLLAPTAAAVEGAKAEMADLAQHAARLQEEGRRREAAAQVAVLRKVAMAAARSTPAAAAPMLRTAAEYADGVAAIDAPGGAANKALKQKTFDAVRAPVGGW
jgi:Ca-activated chloride channel family protein